MAEAGELGKYKIKVANIKGEKAWFQDGKKRMPLKINTQLLENQIIETGKDTYVSILINNESSIHLGPYTRSKILPMRKKTGFWHWSFSLIAGTLRAVVKRVVEVDKSIRAEIHTEAGIIGVRGTDFGVSHSEEDNRTDVYVFKGSVAVTKAGATFFDAYTIILMEEFYSSIQTGGNPVAPKEFDIYDKESSFLKLKISSVEKVIKKVPDAVKMDKTDKGKDKKRKSNPSSKAGD